MDTSEGHSPNATDRDGSIVAAFNSHESTVEELSTRHGISRARVGQILRDAGVDVRAVSRARRDAASVQARAELTGLSERIAPVATKLANEGFDRSAIENHICVFFPDLEPSSIASAIDQLRDQGTLVIDRAASDQTRVPDSVLRSSVLYGLSQRLDPVEPLTPAELGLDPQMVAATSEVLRAGGLSAVEVPKVLQQIQTASEALAKDSELTLSGTAYDNARSAFLESHPQMAQLPIPWPIGSLTISKRLGGSWNAAMESMGLATRNSPKGFGAPQYAAEDFSAAIGDFIKAAGGNSYEDYERWVQDERAAGRSRPVGASVRNAFGTWNEAIRSGGAVENVQRASDRRARTADADSPISDLIEATEVRYEELEEEIRDAMVKGNVSSEMLEQAEKQKAVLAATLRRYKQEEDRWNVQVARWAEQDEQGDRQFKINLWLAIGLGLSAALMPLVVFFLEWITR